MCRCGSWLCLTIALLYPVPYQAEAADVLARSLAERFHRAEAEPIESSASDMTTVGVLKAEVHARLTPPILSLETLLPPALTDHLLNAAALTSAYRQDWPDWPPPTTGRRLSWLQLRLI
ncbi:MAG: hypothetical protein ABI353_14165 [Isosphaeraceae bacterium]